MAAEPGLMLRGFLLLLLAGLGMADTLTAPGVHLVFEDGFVTVNISMWKTLVHPVYASYIIVLQNVNSSSEASKILRNPFYTVLYRDLEPGSLYCVRVQVYDSYTRAYTPFSDVQCFNTPAKALPANLRVEALNLRYTLKWDHEQDHNVTYSVEKCTEGGMKWSRVRGCENITGGECDVSMGCCDQFYKIYYFRVSVYNSQTGEYGSGVVKFEADHDTVMGPPTGLNMNIENGELYIVVEPPEGFKVGPLHSYCSWRYHLDVWRNDTPWEVSSQHNISPHFRVQPVHPSTTYCARVHTACTNGEKTGQLSKVYCITTDLRSYVKEWIIGSSLVGIVVVSVLVYVCLCPLQRYMKHVFYPRSKLPSSITKDLPQNDMRNPFHVPEEESTDHCIIIPNFQPDSEMPDV